MKMTNSNILKILKYFYKNLFTYLSGIFWVVSCLMASHIQITVKSTDKAEIICLCLFASYLFWYTYYKPKNRYLYGIPLYLYVIGYYVIRWDSICEVANVFWKGIFG